MSINSLIIWFNSQKYYKYYVNIIGVITNVFINSWAFELCAFEKTRGNMKIIFVETLFTTIKITVFIIT